MAGQFRKTSSDLGYQLFMFLFGFVLIYPILWMTANSFKATEEIFGSASLLPKRWLFDNYTRGWRYIGRLTFSTFFMNSFIYSLSATLGTVFSSALVSFGFGRISFKGRAFWFACMFSTMIIPFRSS